MCMSQFVLMQELKISPIQISHIIFWEGLHYTILTINRLNIEIRANSCYYIYTYVSFKVYNAAHIFYSNIYTSISYFCEYTLWFNYTVVTRLASQTNICTCVHQTWSIVLPFKRIKISSYIYSVHRSISYPNKRATRPLEYK